MLWTIWALMLVSHGAFARWAEGARSYAVAATLGDALLIAIGLVTLNQLQGLTTAEFLRIGLFFIVFGTAGRQLMHNLLRKFAPQEEPPGAAS